jgi:hypothetical protein
VKGGHQALSETLRRTQEPLSPLGRTGGVARMGVPMHHTKRRRTPELASAQPCALEPGQPELQHRMEPISQGATHTTLQASLLEGEAGPLVATWGGKRITLGDLLSGPSGDLFNNREAAVAWCTVATARPGVDGAAVIFEGGCYRTYAIHVHTLLADFSREELEKNQPSPLDFQPSPLELVASNPPEFLITTDGLVVERRPDDKPSMVCPQSQEGDHLRSPSAHHLEAMAGASSLGDEEAARLFSGWLRATAVERLAAAELEAGAYSNQLLSDERCPALKDELPGLLEAAAKLDQAESDLQIEIMELRYVDGMLQGTGTEGIARAEAALGGIEQAREELIAVCPGILEVDARRLSGEPKGAQQAGVAEACDAAVGRLQGLRRRIHTGDIHLAALDGLVAQGRVALHVRSDGADPYSKAINRWIARDSRMAVATEVTAGVLSILLGIGGLFTGGTGWVLAGAAAGFAGSAHALERADDLSDSARSHEVGGPQLVLDPRAARVAKALAVVDLVLATVDLGMGLRGIGKAAQHVDVARPHTTAQPPKPAPHLPQSEVPGQGRSGIRSPFHNDPHVPRAVGDPPYNWCEAAPGWDTLDAKTQDALNLAVAKSYGGNSNSAVTVLEEALFGLGPDVQKTARQIYERMVGLPVRWSNPRLHAMLVHLPEDIVDQLHTAGKLHNTAAMLLAIFRITNLIEGPARMLAGMVRARGPGAVDTFVGIYREARSLFKYLTSYIHPEVWGLLDPEDAIRFAQLVAVDPKRAQSLKGIYELTIQQQYDRIYWKILHPGGRAPRD